MATKSKIEWTESTWNPVTGCNKISPGCKFCYAERLSKRLQAMGNRSYLNGFELTLQPHILNKPLTWKRPRVIFVNSMSDLFHKDVPLKYIKQVFEVMSEASWHRFQVLTKRPERALELSSELPWPPNIWLGVSVENNSYISRIDVLKQIPASIRFLSLEPLLGPLPNMDLSNIHWAIVGGESGPGARPMEKKWVIEILKQCKEAGVPFFFKQWGGVNKKRTGRLLDGKTYDEMPEEEKTQGSLRF